MNRSGWCTAKRRVGGLALAALLSLPTLSCVDIGASLDRHSDVNTGAVGNRRPPDWTSQDSRIDPGTTDGEPEKGDSDVTTDASQDTGHADVLSELPDSFLDLADGQPGDGADLPETDHLDQDGVDADPCLPDCEDKKCGPDGCGGQCGYCPQSKPVCSFGQCKACKPDCGVFQCGPDGCGGTCGTCPAKFACVGGFCKAPACQGEQILFLESFDSCTQGAFDIVDDKPDDAVTWWALPLKNHSPPCALFLGDPDSLTYDTGGSVHLELLSPEIGLPSGIAWRLTVRIFFELEPVPSPLYPYDYDVLYLRFVELPDGAVTELWSTKEDLNSSSAQMKLLSLDLSDVAGKTGRFLFEFDTVDSVANDYPGIYLDDFRIDVTCPYCETAEDCDAPDSCTTASCVTFANQPEVGGCWEDPIKECCTGPEPVSCDDSDPCTLDACDPGSQTCAHEPVPDCPQPPAE